MREQGASTFVLLSQGSGNEFWQTNFDRESGTYERVYNVELRLGLGGLVRTRAIALTLTQTLSLALALTLNQECRVWV